MSKMEVLSQCVIPEACDLVNSMIPIVLSMFVAFSISLAICVLLINPKFRHKRPILSIVPAFMVSLVAVLYTNWWTY